MCQASLAPLATTRFHLLVMTASGMAVYRRPVAERAEYSNDGFLRFLVSHGVAVSPPRPWIFRYGISYQRLTV
jgi:hypothetical protein